MKLSYLIILLSVIGVFSCDTRDAVFEDNNEAPTLYFSTEVGEVATVDDTLKISIKSTTKELDVRLNLSDIDDNVSTLKYEIITGNVTITQDGVEIAGDIDFDLTFIDLVVTPSQIGTNIIEFTATDDFDQTSTITLTLEAFTNYTPIAVLPSTLPKVAVNDDLEYTLDASGSYDQDAPFGGGVQAYKYTVEGNTFTSNSHSKPWVFSKSGNYEVKLQVMDSDGVWSDEVSEVYSIN